MLSAPRLVDKVRLGVWLNAMVVTNIAAIAKSLDNKLYLIFFNCNYII